MRTAIIGAIVGALFVAACGLATLFVGNANGSVDRGLVLAQKETARAEAVGKQCDEQVALAKKLGIATDKETDDLMIECVSNFYPPAK